MRDALVAWGVLAAAGSIVWLWLRTRQRRAARAGAADLTATYNVSGDGALILAFTTPDCVPCKTIQRPELQELEQRCGGRVVIAEVDATAAHHLTTRFGILTVPSTVVIGGDGTVRAINNAVAAAEQLAAQLGLNGSEA